MELLLRPSVTSSDIVPQRPRPCICDWPPGICVRWLSQFRARAPERRASDERNLGVYPGVFVSLGARLRSVCGSEAGFGAAFRSSSPHAAIPGSVPLRPKRKVLGPECCRVSGVVSHPRTRYFGGSAGSHAGGSELLLVSPPDRTAVLRSGPQFLSAISSTAKAVHLLRDRSGETAQCGCALETESGIAASPGTDSACDSSPVHYGNAARGTAETDAR